MPEVISLGGMALRFLQTGDSTDGRADVFEMTVQPNARMPMPHYHETWDETVYGLAGCVTFRVDGRDIQIAQGETVFVKRGIVHSFRNDTQLPAKCLAILTPGVLGPGYFREMAALLSSGAPDPATMKATMLRYGLVPVPGA